MSASNEDVAEMLADGASEQHIRKRLKVTSWQIARVRYLFDIPHEDPAPEPEEKGPAIDPLGDALEVAGYKRSAPAAPCGEVRGRLYTPTLYASRSIIGSHF